MRTPKRGEAYQVCVHFDTIAERPRSAMAARGHRGEGFKRRSLSGGRHGRMETERQRPPQGARCSAGVGRLYPGRCPGSEGTRADPDLSLSYVCDRLALTATKRGPTR